MRLWDNFKYRCAMEYIDSIIATDKSDRERLKWKVEISGTTIDDLTPGDISTEIPFEKSKHLRTKIDAERLGKIEFKKGNKIEIWKLVRRLG